MSWFNPSTTALEFTATGIDTGAATGPPRANAIDVINIKLTITTVTSRLSNTGMMKLAAIISAPAEN
jgi:hypothetical protein